MAALKKISLTDQIYKQLRENIVNLVYPLGSKLNVNELQKTFEISSSPIREAINRLQMEGLVVYESNVGVHVLTLNEKDVYEVHDLALTLHSAAIRLALERGDHKQMLAELNRYLKAYKKAKSIAQIISSFESMMDVFYHNCDNSRLRKSKSIFQGEQLIIRYLYQYNRTPGPRNFEQHDRLVLAVQQNDPDMAIGAVREIYEIALPVVAGFLNKNSSVSAQ